MLKKGRRLRGIADVEGRDLVHYCWLLFPRAGFHPTHNPDDALQRRDTALWPRLARPRFAAAVPGAVFHQRPAVAHARRLVRRLAAPARRRDGGVVALNLGG